MKLRAKQREGSRVRRSYDAAQTPYQRLLRSGVLNQDSHQRLPVIHHALDPVRLLVQIGTLQDALWRHAVVGKPMSLADSNETNPSAVPPPVKFLAAAVGPTGEETALDSLANYFWFYNHERPHQALGYRTPAEVYFGNLKQKMPPLEQGKWFQFD